MATKIFKAKKEWAQEIVHNLENQILQAIMEMDNEAQAAFSLAPYSMGYIFGFTSRGLESHHVNGDLEKIKLLIQVFSQLFGGAGHEILQISLNLNKEEHSQFHEGASSGREEYLRWNHRQENPIGLLRYILNGEKTRNLNSQAPSPFWVRPGFPLAV